MKIAAAVILYHPDNGLAHRLSTYAHLVDKMYLFDNSENNAASYQLVMPLLQNEKYMYYHDGENRGISERLNSGAQKALEDGFQWLLTMDQDSQFDKDVFSNYLTCIHHFSEKDSTAMFGVQYTDSSLQARECQFSHAPHLITSGSMLNLAAFKNIGPFDEALFIDKVDHEYCLRALAKGYKIIQFNNIYLTHTLGNVSYHRSLKSGKATPRILHSPIRMYYIVRNYFYLKQKYKGQFAESFAEMKRELFNRTKNNFLYGEKKLLLLKYILKGYTDFKKRKMGKLK